MSSIANTEAKKIYDHIDRQMKTIKEERAEPQRFVYNAKTDGVEYQILPQYLMIVELTAKWYAYRDIKEMLELIIDPSIEERRKEIFEALGI